MKKSKRLIPATRDNEAAQERNYNEHYILMSRACMWAKYILLIAFVLYLVIMLSAYRSNITYDNLSYLLKDFTSDGSDSPYDFSRIVFDEQTNMDFAVYNGEFAVAGDSKITLYNHTASKTFEYESGMEKAILCPSEKYLLVYDLGGKSYSIFTKLARVFNSSTESVIENAAMADSGEFILVTRARDSKYTVSYYSSAFENEANYHKSSFVSAATLSGDGDTVAIATVDMTDGGFASVIEFYRRGEENAVSSYSANGLLPVYLGCFEDGSFYAVCDSSVLFFDENGAFVSEFNASGESIVSFDFADPYLCVSLSRDALLDSGRLILFDKLGNISYNIETDHKVSDISCGASAVYVLSVDKVHKYTLDADGYTHLSNDCPLGTCYVISMGDYALAGSKTQVDTVFNTDNTATEE